MRLGLTLLIWGCSWLMASGQSVKEYKGRVSQQYVLTATTPIIDGRTKAKINLAEYERRMKAMPGKLRLVPQFDRFGKASSFLLIPRKSDQGQIVPFDSDQMPEVGEVLPEFEMVGLDGKTYHSQGLRGQFVLLGFWVRFEKPLYTLASTRIISDFVNQQAAKGISIVSLGTTLNSREECLLAIPKRNCGFIPVPESYGFNHRYHIGETPYFILLDKKGKVLAMAAHTEFEKIANMHLN